MINDSGADRTALLERIKELRCLYGIMQAVHTSDSFEDLFLQVTELVPPGMQYPEITRCRVMFDGHPYQRIPFSPSRWKLSVEIKARGKSWGTLEVHCLEEKSDADSGPFLKEEVDLVSGIAIVLGEVVEKQMVLQELNATIQQLSAGEQQLRAANQQLRAANQQLHAGEQQLQAINQQLLAGEQQLRATSEELRLNWLRYDSLFSNLRAGLALCEMLFDENGEPVDFRFVRVNPAYERLVGKPLEDLAGRLGTEIIPNLTRNWIDMYAAVVATGEPVNFTDYAPDLDRHFEIRAFRPEEGHFAALLTDVTSRIKSEKKLLESENRFRSTVECISDAFMVLETDELVITYFNRAAEEILGRKAGDVIGMPVFEAFPEGAGSVFETKYRESFSTGQPAEFETLFEVEPFSNWYSVRTYPGENRLAVFFRVITAQKEAEESARKSLELLQDMTGSVPGLVFQYQRSPEGAERFNFVSSGIRALIGVEPEAVLADAAAIWNTYVQEDIPALVEKIRESERELTPWNAEYRIIHSGTGETRWVEGMSIPRRLPDGATVWNGWVRDITEHKRIEAELERREARFRSVIDNTPFPVAVVSPDDRIIEFWSRSAEELFGHTGGTAEEWFEKAYPDPEYRDKVVQTWQEKVAEARSTGETVNTGTYMVTCADGSVKVCELYALFITGNLIVTFNDITEQVENREKLLLSEKRLQTAVNAAHDLVYQWDTRTDTLEWISDIDAFLGFPPGGVSNNIAAWLDLIHPDDRGLLADAVEIHRTQTTAILYEYRIMNSAGEYRHWQDHGLPMIVEDGRPLLWVGVCTDVTARKAAEKERQVLTERIAQIQKMESIGRLAGGVAHDFNNILTVILGYAEMGMNRIEPDHPLQDSLREIKNAADRSRDITRQLLAFARKQTTSPRVLNLNHTLSGMLKMIRRLIGEDIELVWEPDPSIRNVCIDPAQVDQIAANLCVNARDAIGDVGKLTISTSNATREGRDYVLLTVRDDGCGMDPDTRKNIFEPFFTTKSGSHGSGLGLATVYGIVNQNEGFIEVDSAPGKGTVFMIYLPAHDGNPEHSEGIEHHAPGEGGTETILVVEDEYQILSLICEILDSLGYETLPAATPEKALKLAQENSDRISLLLSDVVMPGMNGRDLAEKLGSVVPGLRIIFMSGYTADVIANRGVLDFGINFIQKPFTRESLARQVRTALDRRD